MGIVIKDGTLVVGDRQVQGDLLIEGEKLVTVGGQITARPGDRTINAAGCFVLPGLIDCHTHFALKSGPYTTTDDFSYGTRSAACGGITTIIDYATQLPGGSIVETLERRRRQAEEQQPYVDFGLHCIVIDLSQGQARELPRMIELGVPSVKVFTTYRGERFYSDDLTIYNLLKEAPALGLLTTMHAENDAIVVGTINQLQAEGKTAPKYHPMARPALAELEAVNRGIFLAEQAGAPLYFVHLTTAQAVSMVRAARARGQAIFAETCPHYLILDDRAYQREYPAEFIMSPPLRSPAEREALNAQVAQGNVDTVGSDHCGYTRAQKRGATGFATAPQGIPGTETMFPLLYTCLVASKQVSLERLVKMLATNPARIFGLYPNKGQLAVGADADVTIYDPRPEWQLSDAALHNAPGGYTPFAGMTIQGRVTTTISRGQVVLENGQFVGEPGHGRFVPGRPFSRDVIREL